MMMSVMVKMSKMRTTVMKEMALYMGCSRDHVII